METSSRWLLTFLGNALWQAVLIAAVALLCDRLLRNAPARQRHWLVMRWSRSDCSTRRRMHAPCSRSPIPSWIFDGRLTRLASSTPTFWRNALWN